MEAEKEQFDITLPDISTGEEHDFYIDLNARIGTMRLLEQRAEKLDEANNLQQELEKLREEKKVDQLEDKSSKEFQELQKWRDYYYRDDISDDEVKKAENNIKRINNNLEEINEQYPQDVMDKKKELDNAISKAEKLGMDFCSAILKPVDGVPDRYDSRYGD